MAAVLCLAAVPLATAQVNFGLGFELTEPGLAYKNYLQDKPPIKHIVYEESSSRLKIGPVGFYRAEGAIQPSGYFLRFPTNSPWSTNLIVSGLSAEHEWEYYSDVAGVCYSPGGFWTNWQASMNFNVLHDLQTAVCLGLPRPYPDDFRWVSQTNFVFTHPVFGRLAGSIIRFEGNRPVEVEYHSEDKDDKYWRQAHIVYEYEMDRDFPPARFVSHVRMREGDSRLTNILHTLEIGLDEKAKQGFFLRDFLPKNARINEVHFMSNWVRHLVRPDGSIAEYNYSAPPESGSRPVRYSIIIVLLVLLTITAGYLVRRRGDR